MNEEFRVGRALGLGISITFRNLIPFLLLTAVISAPLLVWLYSVTSGWRLDNLDMGDLQMFALKYLGFSYLTGTLLVSTRASAGSSRCSAPRS
jgi:hypothetical protein